MMHPLPREGQQACMGFPTVGRRSDCPLPSSLLLYSLPSALRIILMINIIIKIILKLTIQPSSSRYLKFEWV